MKKKLTIISAGVILISIILFLLNISCSKREKNIIKIGAILPLTEKLSYLGQEIQMTMQFFEKNYSINKIKIIAEDSKMNPKTGVNAAQKLFNMDKVNVVITFGTSVSRAILPISQSYKVPQFVYSIDPFICRDGKGNVFRVFYNAELAAQKMVNLILQRGYKKVILFHLNGEAWNHPVKIMLKNPSFVKVVVGEVMWDKITTDFTPLCAKISSLNPDAIIIMGYASYFPSLFKTLWQYLSPQKVQIIGGLDFLELPPTFDKKFIENAYIIGPQCLINPTTKQLQVAKEIERFLGKKPSHFTFYTLDILNIILNYTNEYKGVFSYRNFVKYVKNLKSYQGFSGIITFTKNGDTYSSLEWGIIKNGEIVPWR